MKVSTTVRQEVVLDADAVNSVFRARLDALCGGGDDVYLNDKTGEVESWSSYPHGSGTTEIEDKNPSELKLAALKLRSLLKDAERAEYTAQLKRRGRRTA